MATAPPVVADAQSTVALGLGNPQAIAVSNNGVVYVADTANNRVVTISSTGVVTPLSIPGFTLNGPGALAIDAAGDLYIADTNNVRVLQVPISGSPSMIAGAPTLSLPIAVAVDASGDVYIGDANNAAVYEVPSGGSLKRLTIQGAGTLFPQALATDASRNLYIADGNSNDVYELPFGSSTAENVTPNGLTLNSPAGLAFDSARNFFVLDSGNARIIEVPHSDISHPYQVPVTGFNTASSMALDPSGNLYITDSTNNNVVQLIYAGNPVNLGGIAVGGTGKATTINYELNAPETLTAFRVVVQGDTASEATIVAGSTCKFQSYTVSPIGSSNPITATNPFRCLAKVKGAPAYPGARDGAVNLLGTSSALLNNVAFTETGAGPAAAIFPGVATTPVSSGLEQPQGLAISGENNIVYIADASGGVVYSWKGLNGTSSPLTPVSTSPITLSQPNSVALNGAGDLFIADFALAEIVVVPANTATAPYVLATGSFLDHPITLIIDPIGNLYIGDAGPLGNDATSAQPGFVVKVPPSGAPISIVNTSPASIIYPQALATDAAGDLYIEDGETADIVLVPQDGTAPSTLDIPGLADPGGIAVDPAGALWVLDDLNLAQITIVPANGGTPYTVPLVAPTLEVASLMAFTAGARNLLITEINDAFTSGGLFELSGTQALLSYPQTAVGAQSAAQPADIVSIGNTTLKPTTAGNLYSYGGNTQDFQIANTSSCLSFTQLLPAQSCAFSASFAPISAGAESESITSKFNIPAQVKLTLSGSTTSSSSVAASPTLSPGSGTYTSAQTVNLADATAGAAIYYTLDGTMPTSSSSVYHSAISVSGPQTIHAMAVASGLTKSPVASATYSFPPTARPAITLATGTYGMPTSTTITDSTSGAKIVWCSVASGTCTPTTSYTAAISIDSTTTETICANATDAGHAHSATVCHTYTNSR